MLFSSGNMRQVSQRHPIHIKHNHKFHYRVFFFGRSHSLRATVFTPFDCILYTSLNVTFFYRWTEKPHRYLSLAAQFSKLENIDFLWMCCGVYNGNNATKILKIAIEYNKRHIFDEQYSSSFYYNLITIRIHIQFYVYFLIFVFVCLWLSSCFFMAKHSPITQIERNAAAKQ